MLKFFSDHQEEVSAENSGQNHVNLAANISENDLNGESKFDSI